MFKDQNSTPEVFENTTDDGCTIILWAGEDHNLLVGRSETLAEYFSNAFEIREISVVWGSAVKERNYRITVGTPGNYSVSDWHIGWESTDSEQIQFAEEYDRIM